MSKITEAAERIISECELSESVVPTISGDAILLARFVQSIRPSAEVLEAAERVRRVTECSRGGGSLIPLLNELYPLDGPSANIYVDQQLVIDSYLTALESLTK